MVVELISVGTEMLLGNIVNTNVAYLARKCADLGLSLYYQVTVGDNEERLRDVINVALNRSNVIILTGGLGPTKDDLTKEVTAKTLGLSLKQDNDTKERIEDYFANSKKDITKNNWKQADVIEGSIVLNNNNGTAPGLIVKTDDGKHIILLPGPPMEMEPMFEEQVVPYLAELTNDVLVSKMVKICGIGESMVETQIEDMIEKQDNPTIAPYAKTGEVHLRITAKAESKEEAKSMIKPVVKELKTRFKENIFTTDEEETLEECVVALLTKYDLTVSTAESCTGGLIAGRLVNVSGVSNVLKEGFVTYSNKAKRKHLDVSKSTLKKYGAVSKETAKEMVKGAALLTDADTAISVTGIAGPDGGTPEKPVGLVYIGCYVNDKAVVKEYRFNGNRNKVREQTVIAALDLLRRTIISQYSD